MERAPNSSDEDSEADEDTIVDDDDDRGKLPPGSAKVRWSKMENIKTKYTDNLQLLDRVFLLGDIVAHADNQLGQTGIVVGMRQFCNTSRHDGTELIKVPTKLLQPLAACRPGALVVHQHAHWLGRVDEVYDNVQITFEDGASCKVCATLLIAPTPLRCVAFPSHYSRGAPKRMHTRSADPAHERELVERAFSHDGRADLVLAVHDRLGLARGAAQSQVDQGNLPLLLRGTGGNSGESACCSGPRPLAGRCARRRRRSGD